MGTARQMIEPDTFRQAGDVSFDALRHTKFLMALDQWSQRAREDFSVVAPPVDAIGDAEMDEELAAAFYRASRAKSLSERQVAVFSAIVHHEAEFKRRWDTAKGNSDPRRVAPRDAWVSARKYERMLDVLRVWREALYQQSCEDWL